MRNIVITGASGGIGKAIAERLLLEGNKLSLGIRKPISLQGGRLDPKKSTNNILLNQYEATDKESIANWIDNTINSFGSIDTVIHCAGIFHKTSINFSEEEEYQIKELWETNVLGPWLLTRAVWKELQKKRNSRIITLVSMSGKRSKGSLAGYTATKFALMGLCQTIRNEGWDSGIRVTTISPSWVNTKMANEVNSIDKSQMTQPEDIASIVSNILKLPNSCIPFDISVNCNLEI